MRAFDLTLRIEGPPDTLLKALAAAPILDERTIDRLEGRTTTLTRKEKAVLEHITQGHTNPEIAALLNMGVQTVKSHVRHLLAKTGARNRTHLVILTQTPGHLTPQPTGDDTPAT